MDEECALKYVPTRVLLRSELPTHEKLTGSALLVTGPLEGLLPAAFKRGLSITMPQVQSIYRSLRLPALKHGQGSGAKGGVVKRDYVMAIVKHIFGDSASEAEIQWMVDYTAPLNTKASSKKDKTPEEKTAESLEYLVSVLDSENCEEFKQVIASAKQSVLDAAKEAGREIAEKEIRATLGEQLQEAASRIKQLTEKLEEIDRIDQDPSSARGGEHAASSSSRMGEVHDKVTPREFRSLFQFANSGLSGLSFKHDRKKKFCQVVFPCLLVFISQFFYFFPTPLAVSGLFWRRLI